MSTSIRREHKRNSSLSDSRGHGGSVGQVQVQSPAYAQSPPNSLVASGLTSPPRDRRGNQLSPLGEDSQVKKKAPGNTSTGLHGLSPKAAMGIPFIDHSKGAKRQVIARAGEHDPMEDMMQEDERIANHFKKKRDNKRLPPLPDFSTPPPIMRSGMRPPDKAPILGQYQVHNYKEYIQSMKDSVIINRGGLGANITAEAEAATAKRRKMFQYGSSVNAVNFALMDVPEPDGLFGRKGPPKPIPRKLTREAEIAEIKRQRAMRYGEQFAAPVLRVKAKAKTPQPDAHLLEELKRLEEKHLEDQREIMRIKAQLELEERYEESS